MRVLIRRRITEKEELHNNIMNLKKIHRTKISKKKLKEKFKAIESVKIAAQNIVQEMEDMNPLAKILFLNEWFYGGKIQSQDIHRDIKNFAFRLS